MRYILLVVMVFAALSCRQDPYPSPEPGIIEISYRVVSSEFTPSALNQFSLRLSSLRAIRTDNARLDVLSDPRAIRRSPSFFNALDPAGFDSTFILGSTYAPSGVFSTIELALEPIGFLVLDGYRQIEVKKVLDYPDLVKLTNINATISPGVKTRIVIGLDLDRALIRRLNRYDFNPVLFVTSIRQSNL